MLSLASTAFGVIITPSSRNDGYFHNEIGTAYDFFDSDDTEIGPSYFKVMTTGTEVTQRNAFMQFDISSLTEVAGKCSLNLYIISSTFDSASSAGTIRVSTNSSAANGNASQQITGDVTIHTMPSGYSGWLSLDVTSYVTNAFNNGYDYMAFSFNCATEYDYYTSSGFSFYSADSSINKPYLNVPEPSTYAAIAGAGALGLAFLRRRRKAVL